MVPISTSDSLRITPCPITSIPRRPARPISCVSSPVVRCEKLTPSNLVNDETTTPRAGVLLRQPAPQKARVDHPSEQGLLVVVGQGVQPLGRDAVDGLLFGRGGEVDLVKGT